MDIIKAYSRQSFIIIVVIMTVLCILVDSAFYLGLNIISAKTTLLGTKELVGQITAFQDLFKFCFIPISAGIFVLFGYLLWLFSRICFVKLIKKQRPASKKKQVKAGVRTHVGKKEKERCNRRIFLHLLSLLQREGRLVDFFSEDLNLYEDDQIGAAVRSIHESCKKVINKNLSLKPVVHENEGEQITVGQDFNPDQIKLTGNVTGKPPFQGIVRHRGWQVKKLDMPTLSGIQDSKIIAPAEVEIV